MNQEIKLKLEQAADAIFDVPGYAFEKCDYARRKGFMQGAQHILENPSEWGLVSKGSFNRKEFFRKTWRGGAAKAESQLAKYREVLEKIVNQFEDFDPTPYREVVMYKIAKEALKQ